MERAGGGSGAGAAGVPAAGEAAAGVPAAGEGAVATAAPTTVAGAGVVKGAGLVKGRSCKGFLFYSTVLRSKGRGPVCVGVTRSIPQGQQIAPAPPALLHLDCLMLVLAF
jgi:hypothetical protein